MTEVARWVVFCVVALAAGFVSATISLQVPRIVRRVRAAFHDGKSTK